jgi:hypothetical protein
MRLTVSNAKVSKSRGSGVICAKGVLVIAANFSPLRLLSLVEETGQNEQGRCGERD